MAQELNLNECRYQEGICIRATRPNCYAQGIELINPNLQVAGPNLEWQRLLLDV